MASRRFNGAVVGAGVFITVLGVGFLMAETGALDIDLKYVAPIALIVLGVIVAFRGFFAGPTVRKEEQAGDGSFASYRPRRANPPE